MLTHTITQKAYRSQSCVFAVVRVHLARCRFTVRSFIGVTRARVRQHALPRALFLLLTVNRPVVTICTASLTFNNSTFCPHSVFMCFVWIWEQTAIISLYKINWLGYITETWSVYCAVRTEYVCTVQVNLVLSIDLTYKLPKLHFHSTLTAGSWFSSLCDCNCPLKANFLRPNNYRKGCLDLTFYGLHINDSPSRTLWLY